MCTGRVDPAHIFRAFSSGADGVFIGGCWLGECHYALREFDQAIIEFDAVRRKYPQGDKVPAALLKQGYAFAELGEKVNARLILQELVEKYPQSSEAAKAKVKLKALES